MATIALIGAGGKMGVRLTNRLMHSAYDVLYVEIAAERMTCLQKKGLTVTSREEAVQVADIVILAIPDVVIGTVSEQIVPAMKKGAMLMLLDPAAAYLGLVHKRADISIFIAHPCHPPLFNDEVDLAAKRDFFGGIKAKQSIVCALMQGKEADYTTGEHVAKTIYAPILRSHRITVEQMAMLEPTMAETIGATCAILLKEAMDEAVRRGVPYEAARDFMLGHIHIELAIAFGEAKNPFSDAALVAIDYGKRHLLQGDWRHLFNKDKIDESIRFMLDPERYLKEKADRV